jgi:hypothetical protein
MGARRRRRCGGRQFLFRATFYDLDLVKEYMKKKVYVVQFLNVGGKAHFIPHIQFSRNTKNLSEKDSSIQTCSRNVLIFGHWRERKTYKSTTVIISKERARQQTLHNGPVRIHPSISFREETSFSIAQRFSASEESIIEINKAMTGVYTSRGQ